MTQKHPVQPIYTGDNGVAYFKANQIVRFLLDAGPFDMNMLGAMPWEDEDRVQLLQLLGMSLSAFGEYPFVTDEDYDRAATIEAAPADGVGLIASERETKKVIDHRLKVFPAGSVLAIFHGANQSESLIIYRVLSELNLEKVIEDYKSAFPNVGSFDNFEKRLVSSGVIEEINLAKETPKAKGDGIFVDTWINDRMELVRVQLATPYEKGSKESKPDGATLITDERNRAKKKWSAEHDDEHRPGTLAAAAVCYLQPAMYPYIWPFKKEDWKPASRKENLIRAGSFIAAEIDKMQRMEVKPNPNDQVIVAGSILSVLDTKALSPKAISSLYVVTQDFPFFGAVKACHEEGNKTTDAFMMWLLENKYIKAIRHGGPEMSQAKTIALAIFENGEPEKITMQRINQPETRE